jgi:MarR family transcriptional regulator, 2-MHQ and catechol-resistance regulon repressor
MGTHYKGTKKEVSALNTFIKLIRASDSTISRVNIALSKNKLTESQFSILDALYHLGSMCQKDLGKKLLKSGGNITLVIDNLEKQDLVKRERGKEDRRLFNIYLTENGRSLFEKIFPDYLNSILNEINILTEAEQTELQRLCKKIGLKKSAAVK